MKKRIIKILKWTGLSLLAIFVLLFVAIWLMSEREPVGMEGPEAEQMAEKMMQAVGKEAWDSLRYVEWNFLGVHSYLWDKERHLAKVEWGDYEVLLDISKVGGMAKKDGVLLSAEESKDIIVTAWEYWCNDSFWLNAPVKAKDGGTVRSIVTLEDGRKGLKVQYKGGGVTPGDSYVWILDETGLPVAYKMWVQILPIGGLEYTWEKWESFPGGAKISTLHDGLMDVKIKDLKVGMSYSDFGFSEDPFQALN